MANEITDFRKSLDYSFNLAAETVSRSYLLEAANKEIIPVDPELLLSADIRLYQLKMLVFNPEEDINDKLKTVFSALLDSVEQVNLSYIIRSYASGKIEFFIGVNAGEETGSAAQLLKSGLEGNFPGSDLQKLSKMEVRQCLTDIRGIGQKDFACLTILPADRDDDKENFVQGIEKFIDALRGREYTVILLAESVKRQVAEYRKAGLEMMYSALVPFSKMTLAFGENESLAVGESISDSSSKSLSVGASRSVSDSVSSSDTVSEGSSTSYRTDGLGDGWTFGRNSSTSHTQGKSHSVTNGTSSTETQGTTQTQGKSQTATAGTSLTRTIDTKNKSVEDMLAQIENNIKRIDDAKSFGLWNCACYFISDDIQTLSLSANAFKGLVSGNSSGEEDAHINIWSSISEIQNNKQRLDALLDYVLCLRHPKFSFSKKEQDIKDSGCLISGKDLPLLFGLPRRTIPGCVVFSIAEFGRDVFIKNPVAVKKAPAENPRIPLGCVYHMGQNENTPVDLDLNSFTSHCFIAGSTGSGKSNTTYGLIENFIQNNIAFLVIEPAKGEYKTAFGGVTGINIYTTNPQYNQLLRLNPFRFHPDIHILEHLDRLIEIFNVCWDMTAAMPALMKTSIEQCYLDKGWDLANSICLASKQEFPTFQDLLKTLPRVISNSGYSAQAQSDYKGALVSRVSSLANGIFGQIFCSAADISEENLYDSKTIVDLSRVGSMESKSLIMGLLVMKLSEYRSATAIGTNHKLRHITVIEEAHNLLKHAGPNDSPLTTKSVEMICNSIAEMRTYGEGFIIVDQSPTAVDIAAIKNTNTKIIMKLPEKTDGDVAGNAFGLNEYQLAEIPKLPTGVAIVMQNNWVNPVLTQINRYSNRYEKASQKIDMQMIKDIRGVFIFQLFYRRRALQNKEQAGDSKLFWQKIQTALHEGNFPVDKVREYEEQFRDRICQIDLLNYHQFGSLLLDILNCKDLFVTHEKELKKLKKENREMQQENQETPEEKYNNGIMKEWNAAIINGLACYYSPARLLLSSCIRDMISNMFMEPENLKCDLYRNAFKVLPRCFKNQTQKEQK